MAASPCSRVHLTTPCSPIASRISILLTFRCCRRSFVRIADSPARRERHIRLHSSAFVCIRLAFLQRVQYPLHSGNLMKGVPGNCYTWSSMSRPSRRYNRFLYTDSVLRAVHSVILDTRTMPPAALRKAGLQPGDTPTASEHLPSFVDFELAPDPQVRPVAARHSPMPALGDASTSRGLSSGLLTEKRGAQVGDHDVDTGPSLPCAPPPPPVTK